MRSKLLYGLESAELGSALLNKLDAFQLKGLRKILKIKTKFVNKSNTNKVVMDLASAKVKQQGGNKELKQFSLAYKVARKEMVVKMINANQADPQRHITFERGLKAWSHTNKRVGAPKIKWTTEAVKLLRHEIREDKSRTGQKHRIKPAAAAQSN